MSADHPANVPDRDGALAALRKTRRSFSFIELISGDGGYQGSKTQTAVAKTGGWRLEIVKRANLRWFEMLLKRRIVGRALAWISRYRRLTKDFERLARSVGAFIRLAVIRLMLQRLCPTDKQ